jgi:2-polyprenyl-3-methyl-5-hydroxy-6-metoxy-1,4-benzoquinol methylase
MSCCDPNGLNEFFRGRIVRFEAWSFSRFGLSSRQRRLIALLGDVSGTSIIEVGCGTGAVSTTLLKAGASRASYVEISCDYLREARRIAEKAGVADRAEFYGLDFAQEAERSAPADIVIADRVVCCYPDGERLVERMAAHSRARLVFSYPRPSWLGRAARRSLNLAMRLLGREYRFFLHDPEWLKRAAARQGQHLSQEEPVGPFQLALFERRTE